MQYPAGVFIHPSGVETPLHDSIDAMKNFYGDRRNSYRVWVDQVSSAQISTDTWLLKFDKWELSGNAYFYDKLSFLLEFFPILPPFSSIVLMHLLQCSS